MSDDADSTAGTNVGGPSAAALENLVDPVIALEGERVAYANRAAEEAFDLPADAAGRPAGDVLDRWDRLERERDETTVGTVRAVELDGDYDARVHRGEGGTTITFGRSDDVRRDRRVKERAINEAPVGITIADAGREDVPLVYINDAFERVTGYPAEEVVGRNCRFLQGEESDPEAVAAMREAIEAERPVTVELENYRKDGTRFWNEVTIAPVRDADGETTHYVGFQNDVTARKRAEFDAERRAAQLREERTELERVLSRVEGLVQDVTAAVAGARSRADLEAAVCDRIAAEDAYDAAWIGDRDRATERLETRACAGIEPEDGALGAEHPATRAIREGDVRIGTDERGAVAAFPLSYSGVEYGVLVVRADDEAVVDEREEVILSALARAVASGINARETSRMLATDDVVAVELDLVDRAVVPVALSRAADCRLEYRRSVHRSGESAASLFTVRGASVDRLREAADGLEGVDLRVIVERDDESLVELATDDPGLVEWLSNRGAAVRSIDAEEGRARVELELPQSADVRPVVEAIEERHPGTDVVSFRQREGGGETRQEFVAGLESSLTDRQLAALQRAYLGGYFEWPRPTTGEELASSMGVSRPTFHEHLRAAEGKLCRAFFDDE